MNILFPNELVFESNNFTIHQDWEIPIPGFFIIAPKRTIRTIDEFSEEESIEYILLTRRLRRGMKEILNIRDVYFFRMRILDTIFICGFFRAMIGWNDSAEKSNR